MKTLENTQKKCIFRFYQSTRVSFAPCFYMTFICFYLYDMSRNPYIINRYICEYIFCVHIIIYVYIQCIKCFIHIVDKLAI